MTEKNDGIVAEMLPLDKLVFDVDDRAESQLKGEGIRDLADSIEARGVISPVVVARREDGKFSVVSGKRRVQAARLLKQKTIPGVIRPSGDTLDVVSANFFHTPPPPTKRARALQALLDQKVYPHQKALAKAMGVAESTISRMLSFLSYPQEVQDQIDAGEISASVTYPGGKKTRAKMSKAEILEDLRVRRFLPLPSEHLVEKESGTIAPMRVGVSLNQVRVQVTVPLQSVKTEGLAKALAREVSKVGDKDLSKAVAGFAKTMFSLGEPHKIVKAEKDD